MRYITGIHALNLPCSLDTWGDFHTSLRWVKLTIAESTDSVFGDYGIECGRKIPNHTETFCVANHIRALLDMIVEGDFFRIQGIRLDIICNDAYDEEIFAQVIKLADFPHWKGIYSFMYREYGWKWRVWVAEKTRESDRKRES